LPQIYKKSGVDYFVTQKMTWNDTNQLPFKLFWWESPDGSKVLAYFPHDYANDTSEPRPAQPRFGECARACPGMTDMMDLYGIGDHGGGPTRAILDEGFHWAPSRRSRDSEVRVRHRADLLLIHREADRPDSPEWNYQSIAKGYTPPPARRARCRFRRGRASSTSNTTAA
jgi:alpha-mannosidase